MNKEDLKHIKILNRNEVLDKNIFNGDKVEMFHYDSGLNAFPEDEVERLNKEFYENEYKHIPKILEDGYIEFPVLYDDGPEPMWSRCFLPPTFVPSCTPGFEEKYGLRYNIYIPSYKRAGVTYTGPMLDRYGITNYYYCVDPSQYEDYKNAYGKEKVIIRDTSFRLDEKTDLDTSASIPDYLKGASTIFNCLLHMSKSLGEKCYTTFDDDLMNMGLKAPKGDTTYNGVYDKDMFYRASNLDKTDFDFKDFWHDLEIFYDKCRNPSFISIDKYGLVFNKPIHIMENTRSYTAYITNNSLVGYHRTNQNNDISTSLEMEKYGLVNLIFEGIQYNSPDTQKQAGGSTDIYRALGTLEKAKSLVQAQPNYSKVAQVYSRIHHKVDFMGYKQQRLVMNPIEKD